jgi:hypothetical protein
MRLLLAAIALLTLITGVQTWRVQSWHTKYDVLEAKYQKEKAEAKAVYEQANNQYRALEIAHAAALKDISNDAQAQINKAQLAADSARKSSKRLLDAFANTPGCPQTSQSTALATASQAASAPDDLRQDVLRRILDATADISRFADESRIAGLACERAYEIAR